MKEKTFKDLGLDEGDKYLNKISLDYDLGDLGALSDILNKNDQEEDIDRDKINDINKDV